MEFANHTSGLFTFGFFSDINIKSWLRLIKPNKKYANDSKTNIMIKIIVYTDYITSAFCHESITFGLMERNHFPAITKTLWHQSRSWLMVCNKCVKRIWCEYVRFMENVMPPSHRNMRQWTGSLSVPVTWIPHIQLKHSQYTPWNSSHPTQPCLQPMLLQRLRGLQRLPKNNGEVALISTPNSWVTSKTSQEQWGGGTDKHPQLLSDFKDFPRTMGRWHW